MQSIKELYKIGRGPSSSHTLAPERACRLFTKTFGTFPYYKVELFGSLSLTGKGHHTDQIIKETLPGKTEIIFSLDWEESFPNGFYLSAYNDVNDLMHRWTVFSLGGGSIQIKELYLDWNNEVYHEKSFKEIYHLIQDRNISLLDYIYNIEPDLPEYLESILDAEISCVTNGIKEEGILPGRLKMKRSAKSLLKSSESLAGSEQERMHLMAYAYASSEENASGHTCVTAPTLGACGVIASLMYFYAIDKKRERKDLIDALAIGGLFGNLIKTNATISGAVGGCQAEVGAAVSMASAACAYLEGLGIEEIEYAAEIGMEHNLGLTCDPVLGYVMIPCIERNAMGILRARDATLLAKLMTGIKQHLVSFDMVIRTMNETGKQIPIELKETSVGGLAKEFGDAKNHC